MSSRTVRVRVAAEALFFVCLFAGFYWESIGNSFCNEPGGTGRGLQTLHLALILTAWDSFACIGGMILARSLRRPVSESSARLWLSGAIAAIGFYSAQFVLSPWNQAHQLHDLFNCSCFFAGSYGMIFQLLTAPILLVATLMRESLTQRALGRTPPAPEP